jgi:hypothetical protein
LPRRGWNANGWKAIAEETGGLVAKPELGHVCPFCALWLCEEHVSETSRVRSSVWDKRPKRTEADYQNRLASRLIKKIRA